MKRHHTGFGHPESPFRFKVGKYALKTQGLLNRENSLAPRVASDDELLLCHTREYLDEVQKNIQECVQRDIDDGSFQLSTGDVQISKESDTVARFAAGAVLAAVDTIMEGRAKNAFCLVRPPGHHACSDRGMGFCLYNNVAVGARYAARKYGLKRILIVDWDVHHGNGTQEILYEDPSIFYFSTHNGRIYPGTGWVDERGKGAGEGFNLNFPLDPFKNPREAILEIFSHTLAEAMQSFQPEFVFISAGFDAHKLDPMGGFNLTTQDFADLTRLVKNIAEEYASGRLVSVLEGGYNLDVLAEVIPVHVGVLNEKK